MAKKTKKTNKLLLTFCVILCLVVGAVGGVFANIYYAESYIIPPVEAATKTIAEGSLDVDVIKNQELSIHFIELGNKYTGDCTLIKVGDVEILIDAGSRASSVEPIYN